MHRRYEKHYSVEFKGALVTTSICQNKCVRVPKKKIAAVCNNSKSLTKELTLQKIQALLNNFWPVDNEYVQLPCFHQPP